MSSIAFLLGSAALPPRGHPSAGLGRRAVLKTTLSSTLCLAPTHKATAGIKGIEVAEKVVPDIDAPPLNLAEEKLAAILKQKVAAQETKLGFKLEVEEVADLEEMLRNQYCGKGGLFYSQEGGSCKESLACGPNLRPCPKPR